MQQTAPKQIAVCDIWGSTTLYLSPRISDPNQPLPSTDPKTDLQSQEELQDKVCQTYAKTMTADEPKHGEGDYECGRVKA
jgi:hypothetical protein